VTATAVNGMTGSVILTSPARIDGLMLQFL